MLWRPVTIEPVGHPPIEAVMVAVRPSVLKRQAEPFGVLAELIRLPNAGTDVADPYPRRCGSAEEWAAAVSAEHAQNLVRVYEEWRRETGAVFAEELDLTAPEQRIMERMQVEYALQLFAYYGRPVKALTAPEVLAFLELLPRAVNIRPGRVSQAANLIKVRDAA